MPFLLFYQTLFLIAKYSSPLCVKGLGDCFPNWGSTIIAHPTAQQHFYWCVDVQIAT